MTILVVVESPAKIKKISEFLGGGHIVEASYGHFRNLEGKTMSIDFDNHFEPIYVITNPNVVKKLKSGMKQADMLYIASDLDYEGSAIGQSMLDVLRPKQYKRLIFNAITRQAILDAVKNAGKLDQNQVAAQKARRVLDRLFGYLISPLLQRQIGGKLSAGRVQSPTVRLVIDKENKINQFFENHASANTSFFKVTGIFSGIKSSLYKLGKEKPPSEIGKAHPGKVTHIPLADDKDPNHHALTFLKNCLKSDFIVHSVTEKILTRSPSPPFTTSTLQQEANRKYGIPIATTMSLAQKLYEGGYITYMRTDSVEISPQGHQDIKKVIEKEYGTEYYQKNIYHNKSASSQEAHEAIRPTHPELITVHNEIGDKQQVKLYQLIWKRTIASQMKPAKIKAIEIQMDITRYTSSNIKPFYYFQGQIEKIVFPGFMLVYTESVDDPDDDDTTKDFEGKIPKVEDNLSMDEIVAKQDYAKPPPRYTEASLVKKMETLGIGRPSTFVNTIKTIMERNYVQISNIPGQKKEIITFTIKSDDKHPTSIQKKSGTILLGKENKKMVPTELGKTVNQFLLDHFPDLMEYQFTANLENELDAIAHGHKVWYKVVKQFYDKLKPIVDTIATTRKDNTTDRLLGADENGNDIYFTQTKWGPAVKKKLGGKMVYAKITQPLTPEKLTLEDAIQLLEYPRLLGQYKKKDVLLKKGPYGFYICCDGCNYSTNPDGQNIDFKEAIQIIENGQSNKLGEFRINQDGKKIKIIALEGKFGPYLQLGGKKNKKNYPIPRRLDPKNLTEKIILEIISKPQSTQKFTNSKQKHHQYRNFGSKRGKRKPS